MIANKLYVFSSKRSIGNFYLEYNDNFAPKTMSIGEFFECCIIVKGRKKIPSYIKKILLLQTLYEYKNTHKLLVFDKTFLAYLEGANFLENFFNELALSKKNIKEIPYQDIYGDYEDHLKILQEIYRNFNDKMERLGFYDTYHSQDFEIYTQALDSFDSIEIFIEGVLSRVEQEILLHLAQKKEIRLHFKNDIFNQKFFNFLDMKLEEDSTYKINLTHKKIEEKNNTLLCRQIAIYPLKSRIEQASFAIFKANEWLEKGLQNVALIVPDESFVQYLEVLDTYRNFNYAMGFDIKKTLFYRALNALQETNFENLDTFKASIEDILQDCKEYYQEFFIFHQKFFSDIQKITEILKQFSFTDLLTFYLKELEKIKISDNSGGKISVYGVLETRGMHFDAIVIVDFNEEIIFNFKDNDLFLNTKIRKAMQMPTLKDKQNLQKHYYYQLIRQAKNVDITFVKNNTSMHFLNFFKSKNFYIKEKEFYYSIFSFNQERCYKEDVFKMSIPKDFIFSTSSLRIFFECKRKFYLRYIQKQKAPEEYAMNIGNIFHHLLKCSYNKFKEQFDILEVRNHFNQEIKNMKLEDKKQEFDVAVESAKMSNFWEQEIRIFQQPDYKFLEAEFYFETQIFGKNFKGYIDRLDLYQDQIIIIDYKFSNHVELKKVNEKLCDFQLPIYMLALKNLGKENISCYLYDVRKAQKIQEINLQEKIELLQEKMQTLDGEIVFDKCDDLKNCKSCEFCILCNR